MTSSGASAVAVEYVAGILWYQLAAVAPMKSLGADDRGEQSVLCGSMRSKSSTGCSYKYTGWFYIHTYLRLNASTTRLRSYIFQFCLWFRTCLFVRTLLAETPRGWAQLEPCGHCCRRGLGAIRAVRRAWQAFKTILPERMNLAIGLR